MTTEDRKIQAAVKNATERAKNDWGAGWRMLSEQQRRAAVCEAAMYHFSCIDEDHTTARTALRMIAVAKAVMSADYT